MIKNQVHSIVGIFVSLLLAGCHAPSRTFQPSTNPSELSDVQFLHYLATVPAVSVDEGTRAVLMISGASEQWPAFEERVVELMTRGAIDSDWATDPAETLTTGTLAYMLAAECDVPAGVNLRVADRLGLGRKRYALRACVNAGLLPYSVPNQPVRGGELVSAMTKCAEQRE